jgi:HEAT repeat protein
MTRLLVSLACAAALAAGCSKSKPTTVGDHPPSYWVEQLRDPDAKHRRRAAQHLGNAGATDATVVPGLADALMDADPTVRREAAVALLKIGPAAKSAAGALNEAANDTDARVREAAAKALEKVNSGKK